MKHISEILPIILKNTKIKINQQNIKQEKHGENSLNKA